MAQAYVSNASYLEVDMLLGSHTQCYTVSNGNGNVVENGSQRKLLLSFRANGSALFTFKGLIN